MIGTRAASQLVILGLAVATATVAVPAAAQVTFSEGTFATSGYTLTPTFASGADNDILVGQCSMCGNPGTALRFRTFFESPGGVSLGVVLNGFSFNPTTQGGIASLTASASKNLNTGSTGPVNNFFRPLIEQGGNYYLAQILINQVTGPTTTGYLTATSTLTASDFLLYDFTSGAFGATNPNFAAGPLRFGIGQVSTSNGGSTTSVIDYDNYTVSLALAAVPEPATWALMILGFGAVGGSLRRRTVRTNAHLA